MPEEVYEDDELVGYDPNAIHKNLGAVVLIEGVLYGDDEGEQDYAKCAGSADDSLPWTYPPFGCSKLLKQLEELSLDQLDPLVKSPTSLTSTSLSSLSLKLNKPYWFLHQGNCEHFLVFDQIRYVASSQHLRERLLTLSQDDSPNRSQGRLSTDTPNHPSST